MVDLADLIGLWLGLGLAILLVSYTVTLNHSQCRTSGKLNPPPMGGG